ncbi:RNA methyltransferase [Thalassorhabdomicrobium marinisediminis]|uniref:RNA methyltransferase n=1 Tax=Thalassorhabdomicrobium marinisediminis TaxID=2170577 RepID=A0A2T7FVF6_9RHOB|nr:RNA methyltransferase [Thalassorhabdomicrobium marinisediminis]PVA06170.1 RNA methyltransferase [Thalassorhabdomicrobium marinisediminis]
MPTDTPQPVFVLIRPQMGENIGAAARAMWNFGLDRMRIVAPRDGWPNPAADAMASGAGRLLDEAEVAEDVAGGIADRTYVYAATARPRELTKPVFSPEAAMRDAAARIARGEKVAVMFGPERSGMENADIAHANAIITVPVNPAFPSLNLAQCVLLAGYEWRRTQQDVPEVVVQGQTVETADQRDIEALARHYEDRLEEAGFFYPEHKAENMKVNLRNLWSRMPMTRADVQMLHGALRQLLRGKTRG